MSLEPERRTGPSSNFRPSEPLLHGSVEALKAACEPLRRESWVRTFMLQRDNPAVDLDVLAAPVTSSTSFTFTTVSAVSDFRESALPSPPFGAPSTVTRSCSVVETHLMVPCATVGSLSVGVVVKRKELARSAGNVPVTSTGDSQRGTQRAEISKESILGRFYFCNDTGALFFLLTNSGRDSAHFALCYSVLGIEMTAVPARLVSARKSRVIWWPPISARAGSCSSTQPSGREYFCGTVLTEGFERDLYDQCILFAAWGGQIQRALVRCEPALQRAPSHVESLDTGGDNTCRSCRQGAALDCSCTGRLQTSRWVYDFETVLRNIRQEIRGSWMGSTYILACTGLQVVRVSAAKHSISIAFGDAREKETLGAELLTTAINRLTDSLRITRLEVGEAEPLATPHFARATDDDRRTVPLLDSLVIDAGDFVDEVISGKHAQIEGVSTLDNRKGGETPVEASTEGGLSVPDFPVSCPAPQALPHCDTLDTRTNLALNMVNSNVDGAGTVPYVSPSEGAEAREEPTHAKERKPCQTTLDRRSLLAARRQRNRESAMRSNREKADRNAALRNNLAEARRRMEELIIIERNLRARNVELRARLGL